MGLTSRFFLMRETNMPMGIMKNGIAVFNAPSIKLILVLEDKADRPIKYKVKKTMS
jgi:hypothetical protein|tara:strand:+ start:29276 stop:29443 length:168 start_codon:yes stop_codon:yes gene_type:complete